MNEKVLIKIKDEVKMVKIYEYCPACKHHNSYDDDVSECEMGRHTEHREAENNKGLCQCEYWEAR